MSTMYSVEAESYIEGLECFKVEDIGSSRWSNQHERMEKLYMQAVENASKNEEEFVKEMFISFDKVNLLVYDLLLTEIWKENIFEQLIDMNYQPKATFQIYMILYHEVTVLGLLETLLFHSGVMEACADVSVDLVDYCYRKLLALVQEQQNNTCFYADYIENEKASSHFDGFEELVKQKKKLNFVICIKALSLICYLTEHHKCAPLSMLSRILNTHDIPCMLVEILDNPPWVARTGSDVVKFVENKWVTIEDCEVGSLTKTEGQIWLTLYSLLMESECRNKYNITSYRKNRLLKLRSHLSDILLNQIPALSELRRFLEYLSLSEPAPPEKSFILEQVPEIRETFLKEYKGKWRQTAKGIIKKNFSLDSKTMVELAQRFAGAYNLDKMEELNATSPPKCVVCGCEASKRCSRCQAEWYCRRECQVKHWPKHKQACDMIMKADNAVKEVTVSS